MAVQTTLYRRKFAIAANTVAVVLLLLLVNQPMRLNANEAAAHGRVSSGKAHHTKRAHKEWAWDKRPLKPLGYISTYTVDTNDELQLRDIEFTGIRSDGTRWHSMSTGNERIGRRSRRDTSAASANNAPESNQNVRTQLATISTNASVHLDMADIKLNEHLTATDLSALLSKQHNLSDIRQLSISGKQLKWIDASSLNAMPNIQHMDLSVNELSTFAVHTVHERLESLDLSYNRIRSIDIRNLTHLAYLDLTCNNISDAGELQLNGLAHLQALDISGNRLDALPDRLFVGTQQLQSLRLTGNQFERIAEPYFRYLNNVQVLSLSNNRIRVIENETFSHLLNLQYLDLAHNRLDKASVRALQGIPDLAHLSVAFNRQLGNALQGFVSSWSLKYLDASGTGLCEVPSALAQSVHTLNISYNTFPVSELTHTHTHRCATLATAVYYYYFSFCFSFIFFPLRWDKVF